tara:strand:+ start:1807 stop:2673 length:867 start_codon:yes stop_codon:yes gene_type:complete
LIGNLGEKLPFTSILYLSLLSSIQILTTVPSFIILLSIILLIVFLKSKNELLVIKEYISSYKLVLIFLPFIIFFSFFELNKDFSINKIDEIKFNFLNESDSMDIKVVIEEDNYSKNYSIFKGLDLVNKEIGEYQKYKILNDKIISGTYSDNIQIIDKRIIAKDVLEFNSKDELSLDIYKKNIGNYEKITGKKLVLYLYEGDIKSRYNLNFFYKLIYMFIFFGCLFLILFSKSIIDKKNNFIFPVFICFLLIFYTLFIHTTKLTSFNFEIQSLALMLIMLTFIKYIKYE